MGSHTWKGGRRPNGFPIFHNTLFPPSEHRGEGLRPRRCCLVQNVLLGGNNIQENQGEGIGMERCNARKGVPGQHPQD